MRATQALLSLLAKYATFLRYCVVGVLASGVFYCVANLSALLLKQVDSMGSYSTSAECMDSKEAALRLLCHTANAARNDTNNPSKKVDSRSEAQSLESTFENAQNASKLAQDSRICDEKCGLQGKSQGSYLDGNDRRDFSPLPHLSRKAESSKEARHSQMATLLGSLASFLFGYFAQMRLAFRANPNHSTMLPRYLALLTLIAIYAQAIAYLGAFFTLSYYVVSAFIALSVPLFSYPLQKLWVFAKTSKGGGRLSKDSAFGLESWISSPRFVDRPQVLSSLRGLKSHDSISKILESKSGSKSDKTRRSCSFFSKSTASDSTPKHTQSHDSSSTILESLFLLSLRALRSKAWQSIKSIQPYTKSLESIFQKVDSRGNALLSPFLWLFGIAPRPSIRPLLFAHFSNNLNIHTPFTAAKLMDCRAAASTAARNDRNNATFQSIASLEKVDSSPKTQPTHHDSKHCGGAVVALRDFGGRARLEVCGCPKNRAINRIAYPRLNRHQRLT